MTNEITHEATRNYSIIKVNNYNEHQADDSQNDKRMTNERQTNDKRMTTNKNDKNDKNDKNIIQGEIPFEGFLEWFNESTGKKYRGTDRVKSSFNARIRDGYTKQDLKKALDNALADDYITGDNGNGKWYLTPEYFLRPNILEKWLNI